MAEVIKLKGGSVETILNQSDFEYLVEKHMGDESKDYLKSMIEDLQYEAEDVDPDGYLLSLESNTSCFLEILDSIEKINSILEAPRMNRKKLKDLVQNIELLINNEI